MRKRFTRFLAVIIMTAMAININFNNVKFRVNADNGQITQQDLDDIYNGKITFANGKTDRLLLNTKLSLTGDSDGDGINDIDEFH